MKKIFFALMFAVTIIFSNTCAAKDVWVEHWSDGTDIYVMDDTITSGTSSDSRYFSVSVKHVRNGKLQEVSNREYFKYKDDIWREHVRDHSVALHPVNKLFEFCMNQLGWSYRAGGSDPLVKVYY